MMNVITRAFDIAGFCGLVHVCEEECLSSGISRWTSGSGNATFGGSPRYSIPRTPGKLHFLHKQDETKISH